MTRSDPSNGHAACLSIADLVNGNQASVPDGLDMI